MKELRSALNLLGDQPNIGHLRKDLSGLPLKFWPVFSYLGVYAPEARPIQIVRVLHGAQDLERWL